MEEKNIDPNENLTKGSDKKKEPRKKESKGKGNAFKNWLLEIRAEFGKIIWPKPAELVKETVTVIFTSALVGVVIISMDAIFAECYTLFVTYVGKG